MTVGPPIFHHEEQVTLDASPKEAWDAIKDFDAIHTWHPAAVSTEMLVGENGQPLAVREFQTADGGFVISELLEYDEAGRQFKYRIIKTNMPLRGYVAEMQVAPTENGCSVRWSASFHGPDPQSGSADEFDPTDAVKGIFRMGLDNLLQLHGIHRNRPVLSRVTNATEIYVIRPDGTELRRLTENDVFDGHPVW